ncbi:GlxA family transcriptional regulator [Undibacterium sp. Di27W]|uniref:GlxA family transcriptional regulator n=1 Tax=Undibacterium sp. Di27W TaxID=3413036 RepID=UPI003BF4AEBF
MPMVKSIHVAIIVFDGVQILDVMGPAAVFNAANEAVCLPYYCVHILSPYGGNVNSNSGITIDSQALNSVSARSIDTMLISGGNVDKVVEFSSDGEVQKWVKKVSISARRFGSVCTGAFALGKFGLISGKRVTTHWSACSELRSHYPDAQVDADALYVEDGKLWTSAGVTTGIDMSLAMVANDLGDGIADAIAKELVLYARRPGHQSQFSSLLKAQLDSGAPFSQLINWIKENLAESLDVSALANRAMMSDRTFSRKFTSAVGESPAHFVETIRLDHARQLLTTALSLKEIAEQTGYQNAAQFIKAFNRRFGISPAFFRKMNAE